MHIHSVLTSDMQIHSVRTSKNTKSLPHQAESFSMQCNKQDCKPGYVENDHLSRTAVTNSFKRPTWKQIGQIYGFLFGLASDGVYMAPPVTSRTVVSYTAFPPLPSFRWRYISVALALESPPPDVIRHPALWSPDFPHLQYAAAIIHPTYTGLFNQIFF